MALHVIPTTLEQLMPRIWSLAPEWLELDWSAVAVTAGRVALAAAIVVVAAKAGVKMAVRGRRASHSRKALGEYQPPEPPEGRYWG